MVEVQVERQVINGVREINQEVVTGTWTLQHAGALVINAWEGNDG